MPNLHKKKIVLPRGEKVAILPVSIPLSLSLQFAVSSRLSRLPAPKKREKAKEEAVLIFALRSLPSSPYLPTEQSLHLPFRPPTKQAAPGRESTIFWPPSCLACPDPFLAPPQTFGAADLLNMTKGGGEEREKGPDTRPTSFAPSSSSSSALAVGQDRRRNPRAATTILLLIACPSMHK